MRTDRRKGEWGPAGENSPISSQILTNTLILKFSSFKINNLRQFSKFRMPLNDHDLRGKVSELTPFACFVTAWRDGRLLDAYLPLPRCCHPFPSLRFAVTHPR